MKSNNKIQNKILWNNIDWKVCTERIDIIQRRIYNASRKGQKGKVLFLQNLIIHSLDAKLLAVKRVTTDSSGKKTPGLDKALYLDSDKKMDLVRSLKIDGRAAPIRRVLIPKPGKPEKRPLGIPIIRDRAKQKLVLMALEPEWEAKFEPNSFGFRPGHSTHDAIEAIFRHLRNFKGDKTPRKFILDADLKGCFDNIDHDYLLNKLGSSPLINSQVKAWLKAGIFEGLSLAPEMYGDVPSNELGTPQGGVISPFLANVALHGMESFLKEWIKSQTWPVEKKHQLYTQNKIKSIGIIRYADDFVIIHSDKKVIENAMGALSNWLNSTSKLKFNDTKTRIIESYQGFDFLGFSIINVIRNGIGRIKIYPSTKNQKKLIEKIGDRCRKFRSISSFDLIKSLRPIIIGWGNYFRYCDCQETFSKLDRSVFNIIRSWVFRRDRRNGRRLIKERYFPSDKTFLYQGRIYKNNWILCGKKKLPGGVLSENHLPKLSWITSEKFISIKGDASVYNGDDAYWSLRSRKYGGFNTRQRTLLQKQKGKCPICGGLILDKFVQVDHIIPRQKGGKDVYSNLQLLHTHCHIKKTSADDILNDLQGAG
jgi:group II intron reverse transcriptase/maturase